MTPTRAKVSRSWLLRYGSSSIRPRRERVLGAVQEAGVEQPGTSSAVTGP